MTTAAELRLMLDEARAMPYTAHRGLKILRRHVDWLDRAPSPMAEMMFAAHASLLLLRRLTESRQGGMTVRRAGRDEIPAAELWPELAARARALAARFDARNGTGRQGALVEAEINAEPYAEKLEFSPRRRAMIEGENR